MVPLGHGGNPMPDGRGESGREGAADAPARAFVEECLGTHSSHPAMARARLSFWRWLGASVGACATAFSGYMIYRAFSWEKNVLGGMLAGFSKAMKSANIILAALAIGLAATLAAALTVRIARLGPSTSQRPFSRGIFGLSLMTLSASLVGISLLCGWLVSTNSVAFVAEHRWWVAVAAALPLEALLLYSEIRERREGASAIGWLWMAVRQVCFAAAVAASAIVMTPGAAASVGKGLFGWLAAPSGPFGAVLAMLPVAGSIAGFASNLVAKKLGSFVASTIGLAVSMAVVTWVTAKVNRIATESVGEQASQQTPQHPRPATDRKRSWLSRALSFLNPFNWLRRGDEPAAEVPGDGPAGGPAWLASVAKALEGIAKGPVASVHFPPVRPESAGDAESFSPESGENHLEILFNSRSPTADQVAALQMFDERWFRHSRALQAASFGPAPQSHADMFVQAYPESYADPDDQGVLEFQVAAAMIAVVARGQRVLFLVPGDDERGALVSAVQSRFEALRIETLYRVGSLAPTDISGWAPPAAAPGTTMEERPPDVLVATLGDYEEAFFGGASSQHLMRALLFDAEVVMVPDLLALSRCREGRLHLPFILDKHRLLLASENRSMQLVIGSPPIGERPVRGRDVGDTADGEGAEPEVHVAMEAIAQRFFGGDSKLTGHSCVLRRRRKSAPARIVVRVPAATLRSCLDAVACHAAKAEGLDRVCILVGREDPRPDRSRMDGLSVDGRPITVIHELDCADALGLRERLSGFAFVLLQGRIGDRLVREAMARVDHGSTVIVEVTSGKAVAMQPVPSWSLTLPVFPSAESPALALAHLRSAAFQLAAECLVRRDEFVRFGVSWNRSRWAATQGFRVLHEGWSIELDGRAGAQLGAAVDQGEIWPAAILRAEIRKERPVRMTAPVERGLGLSGADTLHLAEDGTLPDPRRGARWVMQRGQILGTVDLAYAGRFVWEGDRQTFRAGSADRAEDEGWIITGLPYHGEPDEPELPATEVTVRVPAMAHVTALQLRQGERIRLFTVRDRSEGDRCTSEECISGLIPRDHPAAARGGVVDPGSATPFGPISFRLRAGISLLCLGRRSWLAGLDQFATDEGAAGVAPAWLVGEWTAGRHHSPTREFSPAFTSAVQRAVRSIAPGLLEFTRVMAFRIGGSEDGVAIVFVEPFTTVGTAAETIRTVLDDRALRQRFVGHLLEAVASGEEDELPGAPVYLVPMDEEALSRDRDWARRLITAIPGSVIDLGSPFGVIARDSAAALDARPEFTPTPMAPEGNAHRWSWKHAGETVELSVQIGIEQRTADEATQSFGCSPSEGSADRLARCGIRMYEGNRIGPDYGWMVRRSEDSLKELGQRLLVAAQQAGASSLRDRVEFFASFVQSFRYERDAQGRIDDGKLRMGVQMPAETLFTKRGDCDSLSVLLVALVRAAGLAKGCVVLIDDVDGGHAVAAFEVEPRTKQDWSVTVRFRDADGGTRTFTVVETTALGWRIGTIASEYHGRYVRLDAIG